VVTLLKFLQTLTNFYNIRPTVCWINLQQSNYIFTSLTYVLLLLFVETSHLLFVETVIWITSATKAAHYCCTKLKKNIQFIHTNGLHLSPMCSKYSFSSTQALSLSLLRHSPVTPSMHNALQRRQSNAASGRPHLELVSYRAPYSIVNWIKMIQDCSEAIKSRRNEHRSFTLHSWIVWCAQYADTLSFCWKKIFPKVV